MERFPIVVDGNDDAELNRSRGDVSRYQVLWVSKLTEIQDIGLHSPAKTTITGNSFLQL